MPFSRMLALAVGVLLGLGAAHGQILMFKKVGGRTVICALSGLSSDLKDCGVSADSYSYVFVGSIIAVMPAPHGEETVQIDPEEIFHGHPSAPLVVQTSQAECGPKLAVGDRWLFYLSRESGKPIIFDVFAGPSLPVADAQQQLRMLRRLQTIGDRGIVRGTVRRGQWGSGKPVANVFVVASGGPNRSKYVTATDSKGHYQFPPLPAGSWKISVDPTGSFHPEGDPLDVHRGSCWDLTIHPFPHGDISGYVRYSDGSPVKGAQVMLAGADGSWYNTLTVSPSGHFNFDSLSAGRYIVGIRLPGSPVWKTSGGAGSGLSLPVASLYYPDVDHRASAQVIVLSADEKLHGIDFTLPAP